LPKSSDEHSLIATNIGTLLYNALKERPFYVFGANGLLAIDANGSVPMPDVHVIFGEMEPSIQAKHLHSDLGLVLEVVSDSIRHFDSTRKFDQYKMLASFREYVLVDSSEIHIEVFSLNDRGAWEHTVYLNVEESQLFKPEIIVLILPL
jgi:Uma2 family endonuclease